MAAETVTCAKGNTYKLHKEHTLTDKKDVSAKPVPVESTKAIVLFIGGAGDRELLLLWAVSKYTTGVAGL